jgi:phage-related protein
MAAVDFYRDGRGREPINEYFFALSSKAERASITKQILLLKEFGHTLPLISGGHSKLIDKRYRIFELRAGKHRIAYGATEEGFVLLHIWRKTTQKLDPHEALIARNRFLDWVGR